MSCKLVLLMILDPTPWQDWDYSQRSVGGVCILGGPHRMISAIATVEVLLMRRHTLPVPLL